MESLIGYGSDDEYDDLSHPKKQSSSQADANYEEVQMDLSEESNDSTKLEARRQSVDHFRSKIKDARSDLKGKDSTERDKYKKSSDDYTSRYEHGRYSPKYQDSKRDSRNKDKGRSENSKSRDEKSRDYKKDRGRDDKKVRDEKSHDNRKYREDQDKSRDNRSHSSYDSSRDERRSHRTSSRDRHRSRSPRRSDYRNKRSSSRERSRSGYSKGYDRTSSKMDRLEKLGIELNASNSGFASTSGAMFSNDKEQDKDRFYMPGITGRFTEQIQRRKLLWQKKDAKSAEGGSSEAASTHQPGKIWQNTTFAQDTDGKVANKFKRLMGIRGTGIDAAKPANDNLKKQEEMFSSMEAQYEVARTATHTMRGVGLGFGSFQR